MNRLQYLKNIKLNEISFERLSDSLFGRIRNSRHLLWWMLPFGQSKINRNRLEKIKDIHTGERCFIIANGPSLNQTDLSLLKNEYTIAMNRGSQLSEQRGLTPTYLVVADIKCSINPFIDELDSGNIVQFSNWNARKLYKKRSDINFLKQRYKVAFSKDITWGVWGGHSVTNICIQLAYYMGFQSVILIGKDHDYKQKGVPGKSLTVQGDEGNHGIANYYAKDMVWKLPDYKGEELGYKLARAAFEEDSREIFDASIGGKLTVFEKIDFKSLFPVETITKN